MDSHQAFFFELETKLYLNINDIVLVKSYSNREINFY